MDYSSIVLSVRNSIALVFVIRGDLLSAGTGFVFFREGVLVTCNHVIPEGDVSIKLKFPDSENYLSATVMIRDMVHDVALLKFDDLSRKPLQQAEQDSIKEGMPIIFSGYPLSLLSLITHQGILSSILKDATGKTAYLIDGTVNSGNSGCPLMTAAGKVIGVVNAKQMEQSELLGRVQEQKIGAISIHCLDIMQVLHAIINNVQLAIGYAIPCSYIPKPPANDSFGGTDNG